MNTELWTGFGLTKVDCGHGVHNLFVIVIVLHFYWVEAGHFETVYIQKTYRRITFFH
jgi:hypothetical protein